MPGARCRVEQFGQLAWLISRRSPVQIRPLLPGSSIGTSAVQPGTGCGGRALNTFGVVMGWGFGYWHPQEVKEIPERRLANRPHRGKRTKVKAARKAARR